MANTHIESPKRVEGQIACSLNFHSSAIWWTCRVLLLTECISGSPVEELAEPKLSNVSVTIKSYSTTNSIYTVDETLDW